ncbi:MAG: arylsulfatase [Myxococcota bacterium]|jgi:arylsulfatase
MRTVVFLCFLVACNSSGTLEVEGTPASGTDGPTTSPPGAGTGGGSATGTGSGGTSTGTGTGGATGSGGAGTGTGTGTGTGSTEPPPLTFADGTPPANVLMISIDTLRRDHLTRWGGPGLTPFLDSLIDESVVLDDHLQCSNWTFASMSCTTLGRPGWDMGWVTDLLPEGRRPMPPARTLPLWMGQLGFYSVLNSLNSWFSDEWGTAQGYDRRLSSGWNAGDAIDQAADALEDAYRDGDVGDHWLMHVHVMEPHASYSPPGGYLDRLDDLPPIRWDLEDFGEHYDAGDAYEDMDRDERVLLEAHMRVRYEGELQYLDDQLREAFDDLGRRGLLEDTLVVVYNDHGESFWEHDHQTHAHTLHGQENDGILFFWSDDIVPRAWDGPTHATDLAATLVALYGGTPDPVVVGVPLGTAPDDRARYQYTQARQGAQNSVVKDEWKLLYDWDTAVVELYDRNADPEEAVDLYAADHPRVTELWPLLRAQVELMAPLTRYEPDWPAGL